MMDHAQGRRRRSAVAVLLAGLLVTVGACKSSGDSKPTGAGSSGASGASSAATQVTNDPRAPGVTADTVKVGVTYPDLSSLKDVLQIDNGDFEKAFNAVADDINGKGGINGRKLQLVFAPINPTAPNAFDAACTKLTQDEKVFVAVGFFLADNVTCYIDTNATPVIGGEQTDERLAKAKVAWYTTDPSQDSAAEVVRVLASGGKLAGKVAVVGQAADQKAYDTALKPVLDEAKVNVVDTAFIDAPSTDAEANYAQAQDFSERFKADGAEQVLVIGTSAPGYITGLARTDYRPELRFTDPNSLTAYTSSASSDLSPLVGAVTGGLFDGQNRFPSLGDPTKECLDIQRAAGLTLTPSNQVPKGQPNQISSSGQACTQMYLLKAILQKAGKDLNFGTFKTAGDNLGEITLPMTPDPWFFGPPPHADGDSKAYLSNWDPASKTFVQQS